MVMFSVLAGRCYFSRPASGNPIQASHRRDDSVPREEPHVLFVRIAFALKGPYTSAQGKATRVLRASPSPWVAYQRGKKALKGRDNQCIGLCRPFRAWEPIATTTRGGATLCPGLICPCPFRAHHRSPQDPERWRDRPHQPRAASTPNEPDDRERERRKIRSKPATSGQRKTRQPASGAGVCPRTTAVTGPPRENVDFRTDLIGGSGSPLCYDLRSPPGDAPPCHPAAGRRAGGCSFSRPRHDTPWRCARPVGDAVDAIVGPRGDLSGPVASGDSGDPANGPVFAFHPTARCRCERPFRFFVAVRVDVCPANRPIPPPCRHSSPRARTFGFGRGEERPVPSAPIGFGS
jgi:hypothetical protein